MIQLKATNLCVGYDKKVVAKNLNFEIEKGSYVCVVGENGSGKSTLIKTLLGLLPKIDGQFEFFDISKTSVGYLPQQTNFQKDFPASVNEIVLSGCLASKKLKLFYNKKDRILAEENMRHLGIFDLKNKPFFALSGGQQQRVLLARALCATSELLVLDEPVSGLDVATTHEMYATLKKLNSHGITIIMVSHDICMVTNFASHILHLGKDVFWGTAKDYQKTEQYKKLLEQGGHNNGH